MFDEFTQPIPLINRLISSGTLQTSGWGDTDSTGRTPNELYYIDTKVISLDDCEALIPGLTSPDTICIISKYISSGLIREQIWEQ